MLDITSCHELPGTKCAGSHDEGGDRIPFFRPEPTLDHLHPIPGLREKSWGSAKKDSIEDGPEGVVAGLIVIDPGIMDHRVSQVRALRNPLFNNMPCTSGKNCEL